MKKGGILGGAGLTARALLLTFCFPAVAAYAGTAGRHVAGMPFEPLTPADLDRGHMRGTGCVWMDRERGPMRFVAVDDRAMVKLGGGLRMLRPARGAADMFPFTYDRWISGRPDDSARTRVSYAGEILRHAVSFASASVLTAFDGASRSTKRDRNGKVGVASR